MVVIVANTDRHCQIIQYNQLKLQIKKMGDEFVEKFFAHVDANTPLYIERLAEAVA